MNEIIQFSYYTNHIWASRHWIQDYNSDQRGWIKRKFHCIFTVRSCWKVMFSCVSVCSQGGFNVIITHHRTHLLPWTWDIGPISLVPPPDMQHVTVPYSWAWLPWWHVNLLTRGPPLVLTFDDMAAEACTLVSKRYASYWNSFLFLEISQPNLRCDATNVLDYFCTASSMW